MFLSVLRGGLPWWLSGKESVCNAGDLGLIPGLGRAPGEGNGNPFQYSCLGNPMDRGAWRAAVRGVTKSQAQLSTKQQPPLLGRGFLEGPWSPGCGGQGPALSGPHVTGVCEPL